MQIQTILNRVEKQKGFVYSKASFNKKGELEIEVRPRRNSRAICSGCGKKGSTYDHSSIRQFQFVPLWGIAVFLVYAMRRVNCKECGVTTERIPWACGKNQHTYSFRLFLATWAKRLSCKETACVFSTSWDSVYRAVQWVVHWGIAHRELSGIESIGFDEIQHRRGHHYLTLGYRKASGCGPKLQTGDLLIWVRGNRRKRGMCSCEVLSFDLDDLERTLKNNLTRETRQSIPIKKMRYSL
jgi:transposase